MGEQLELPLGDNPRVKVVRRFEVEVRPSLVQIEDAINRRNFDEARLHVRAAQDALWIAYVGIYGELYKYKA